MHFIQGLLFGLPVVYAAQTVTFVPPARSPTSASDNYVGKSNSTLPITKRVRGKVFDRFITIIMENTNFAVANSSATFQKLAQEGITLTSFYALGHPSEPNYAAMVGGDTFGMADDGFYHIPSNITTVVDLLEDQKIGWASYQENMPTDGDGEFTFTSKNYLNTSAAPYTFYWRKHNSLIIYDSIATVPSRAARLRNFNDFARDIKAEALPQWMHFTPNIVNDAHDTDINFGSQWLEYWLVPLLEDERFNDERTLILLTFDENGSHSINNQIFSVLLGGAVSENLRGTTDSTYYTHYSAISTVESNWGLKSLGRGDTDKTMGNVFEMVAKRTGFKNRHVTDIPLTNLTGGTAGPLNPNPALQIPYPPPDYNAVGAGGGPVCVIPGCPGLD